MFSREDAIRDPQYGTFEWILEADDHDGHYTSSNSSNGNEGADGEDVAEDHISWDDVDDEDVDEESSDEESSDENDCYQNEYCEQKAEARSPLLRWLSSGHGLLHIFLKAGS